MGKEKTENKPTSLQDGFKFRYLVYLFGIMILLFALISHSAEDLNVLSGGYDPVKSYQNWAGLVGAKISQILYFGFGLAIWPILLLILVACLRPLLATPVKRRGYFSAMMITIIGITMIFAMYPESWIQSNFIIPGTEELGLGHQEAPLKALSGGVIGQFLAAPPIEKETISAGLFRAFLGEVGTASTAILFIVVGLFFIFLADWKNIIWEWLNEEDSTHNKKAEDEDEFIIIDPNVSRKEEEIPISEDKTASSSEDSVDFFTKVKDFFGFGTDDDDEPEKVKEKESIQVIHKEISEEKDSELTSFDDKKPVALFQSPRKLHDTNNETPNSTVTEDATSSVTPVINCTPSQNSMSSDSFVPPPFPESNILSTPEIEKEEIEKLENEEKPKNNDHAFSKELKSERPNLTVDPNSIFADSAPIQTHSHAHVPSVHSTPAHDSSDTILPFTLPPIQMLTKVTEETPEVAEEVEKARNILQETLNSFKINGWISSVVIGPRVIRFELSLDTGVNVKKIAGIQQNIAMNLAAENIRVLAPIPGKTTVGIEVPNPSPTAVFMRQIVDSPEWQTGKQEIPIVLGKNIEGEPYIADLAKMPHLLIAGATGAGKSVCMNTLIMSLLFKFTPDQLRLIMVDPKVVEMEMYRTLPHLITPVVNDSQKVPLALRWGVSEMERRYRIMAKVRVKHLVGFNQRPAGPDIYDDAGKVIPPQLPYLVIIIDELADVMMTDAKSDVETSIARIAQKGRAAGIHLVIATQRPSVNIITGVIKANLPTRIAFRVGSQTDSRVILDQQGAERLLGKGDMLFVAPGGVNIERIQGAMVHDPDIEKIVNFVSEQRDQRFLDAVLTENNDEENAKKDVSEDPFDADEEDQQDGFTQLSPVLNKYLQPGDSEQIKNALQILFVDRKISISYLQRRLGVGYNKAAEIIDLFEKRGLIGPEKAGGAKRDILIFDELSKND